MTIILENICKTYNGQIIINNFNLEIEWDRCYAIVGPKGSGKSSLLKIFMGTEKPDKGEVSRMGDYKYPTLHSAYVSDEGKLNPKKNAIWNIKKSYRRAGKSNIIAELLKFLPEEKLSIPTGELSVSEKRFVELVGALFTPADFIVLDEPFLQMTEDEKSKALAYILEKRGSRPLLIASEDESGFDFAKIVRL